jgi:Fic family protein
MFQERGLSLNMEGCWRSIFHHDTELIRLLTEADRSLGRLDGVTSILPNPELFVAMYVKQEAVLSSQIDGTQSTLEDVLQFAVDAKGQE